ncbi:MAG: glucose/sorbosone family PQQ-dependent dehydrogenase [Devosia sp.]
MASKLRGSGRHVSPSILAAAGALLAGLAAGGPSLAQDVPVELQHGSDNLFTARVLTTGLSNPWEITWGPDDMLWVTERSTGEVTRVDPFTGEQQTLLKLTDFSVDVQHQGLLGMALHPDLLKGNGNDFVYLAYTYETGTEAEPAPRQRLVRYTYDADAQQLVDPVVLIEGIPAGNDHNAGRVKVGPDMKIYYTLGEQGANFGGNYQKENRAQWLPTAEEVAAKDYHTYSGKVLRLNLDGSIPEDNPEINGVRSHIFTYGHRNPQGIDVSPKGNIYVAEHGPDTDDELNLLQPGGNYGWPNVAGFNDDKAYVYANWSAAPKSLRYTGRDAPPEVPQQKESDFKDKMVDPLATYWTVDDSYDFAGNCGWICNPTIAPGSVEYYAAGEGGIKEWDNSVLLPTLKHGTLYVQHLSEDGKSVDGLPTAWFRTQNRYRDTAIAPDHERVFIATDGFGTASQIYGDTGFTNVLQNPGAILLFTYTGGQGGPEAQGGGLSPLEPAAGQQGSTEQRSTNGPKMGEAAEAEQSGPPEVSGDQVAGGKAEAGNQSGAATTSEGGANASQPAEAAQESASADQGALDLDQLVSQGKTVYASNCAACHGAAGQGAQGPAFTDNEALGDAAYLARTIVHGFGYMPRFGDRLSDEQIAAVSSYVRNSWGNEFGPVQPSEVAAQR